MYTRLIYSGPNSKLRLDTIDENDITVSHGQILAKILMSTICGSDVHTILGKRTEPFPSVLGHEGVAEIVACKRNNGECKPGDRITFSIVDCCGTCDRCQQGVPQKCFSLAKYGHLSLDKKSGWTGCYASHILLEPNTAVFKVDPEIPPCVIAPINCAMATMVNAISQIPTGSRKKVLLQGAGLLGVYGSVLLKEAGCSVVCSDIDENRLDLVKEFGARASRDTSAIEANSMDAVIEVCGHAAVVKEGYRCLRPGGTYVLVGLVHPQSQLPITAEDIIRKCLTVTGVHNYKPEHLKESVEFVTRVYQRYPFETLVSKTYPLVDAEKAIAEAIKQTYHRVAMSHFC